MNHRRRACTVGGLLLVLTAIPASDPLARAAGEQFSGYDAVASGQAFTAYPVVPALLPVDAPFEGTVSLATATLSTGGLGFGRASSVWPGTPIVGIRPLIEVASGERLPTPDYPLVVESREYEPAKRDSQPGMTMESDVKPERATATAVGGPFSVPEIVDIGSARTVSVSTIEDDVLQATTTTRVGDISFVGGVVKIDSITSVASAGTDTVTGTCGGTVRITGLEVAGVPAVVDRTGVHAQDQSAPVVPDPNEQIAGALASSGITIRLLGGLDRCVGANASRTTSGVLVSVPLPSAASVPPGGRFDVILASASANASANPAFEFDGGTVGGDDRPVLGDVVGRAPGPIAGGSPEPLDVPGDPGPAPTEPDDETTFTPAATDDDLDYTFDGVPMSLVLGLMALAVPGATRVRRYMERLFAMSTS